MDFNTLWNLDISAIWELADSNDFIIAMSGWLCRKSNCGENMAVLTTEEQVFYICNVLEGEVNNGGFSQYLYNSSGNNAYLVAACMDAIGAHRTAEICHRAVTAFNQPIPQDRDERQEFLDKYLTDEIDEVLSQCDSMFYQYEDNLELLAYSYIQRHRDCFT